MEKKSSKSPEEIKVSLDLRKVLAANPSAQTLWKDLTPVARRDFVTWIESAKKEETRKQRIESMPSRLLSGKRRPCCYAIVPMSFYKVLGSTPKAKATWGSLTPTERRDFVSWINETKDQEAHMKRIEKACVMLITGKRHP